MNTKKLIRKISSEFGIIIGWCDNKILLKGLRVQYRAYFQKPYNKLD